MKLVKAPGRWAVKLAKAPGRWAVKPAKAPGLQAVAFASVVPRMPRARPARQTVNI